jgi:hypothetical protein
MVLRSVSYLKNTAMIYDVTFQHILKQQMLNISAVILTWPSADTPNNDGQVTGPFIASTKKNNHYNGLL